ncbi:hypothetical protein SH1V18_36520 [Vallitalea longa]|uniref:SLH domain-containing protein n=1 Tax=Vallitalea longa TaxID=2936439 RepID=A0A9W6DH39_9FIRM|nr:S-layer homology domain-containing protein [Vallitalea longa]GKX31172.1 hypothetical protein SH1V18_36520 [Vallitalea longa]
MKKTISLILVVTILVTMLQSINNKVLAAYVLDGGGGGSYQEFSDLPSSHYATKSVNALVSENILNGYPDGTFRPDNPVEIQAFVKMTLGALGYTNLPEIGGHWANAYMQKAKELGLFRDSEASYQDNQFFENHFIGNRTRYIKRQEVCFILNQAEKIKENGNIDYEEGERFIKSLIGDFDNIDDVYKKYVIDAYGLGLMNGVGDNQFDPKGLVTRAQAAVLIYRLLHEGERVRTPLERASLSGPTNGHVGSQLTLNGYCKNAHHISLQIEKPDGTIEYITKDNYTNIFNYTPEEKGFYKFTLLARNTVSSSTTGTDVEISNTVYVRVEPPLEWLNWEPSNEEIRMLYRVFEYMYNINRIIPWIKNYPGAVETKKRFQAELIGIQTMLLRSNNIILHDPEAHNLLYNDTKSGKAYGNKDIDALKEILRNNSNKIRSIFDEMYRDKVLDRITIIGSVASLTLILYYTASALPAIIQGLSITIEPYVSTLKEQVNAAGIGTITGQASIVGSISASLDAVGVSEAQIANLLVANENNIIAAIDGIANGGSGFGGASHLSNSKAEHVLKNHTAGRMQNTVDAMMEKGLVENAENLVKSKGFFNTSWTEQQVINATNQAYNQALKNGVPNTGNFDFTTSVFGENVTLNFQDGIFKSAWGDYILNLSDFGY